MLNFACRSRLKSRRPFDGPPITRAALLGAMFAIAATLPAPAQNLVIDTTAANSPLAVTAGNQTFANIIVGNATSGVLNQSGGTLTANGGGFDLRIGGNGGASGIVNLTGGVLTADQIAIGGAAGATGTFNLDGGRVSAVQVSTQGGTSTFNFNGGTLQAAGNSTAFMRGLTTANMRTGGAVIDTRARRVSHSAMPPGV